MESEAPYMEWRMEVGFGFRDVTQTSSFPCQHTRDCGIEITVAATGNVPVAQLKNRRFNRKPTGKILRRLWIGAVQIAALHATGH